MTTSRNRRSTAVRLLAPLMALGLFATACGSDDAGNANTNGDSATSNSDATGSQGTATATGDTTATPADTDGEIPDGPTIRLRGQEFSESATIAEVYGQFLKARGYDVEILTPAGFRTEALDGIKNGDFDLTVDYIGGIQAALAPDEQASSDPAEIVTVITPGIDEIGGTLLDFSPAADGDALVVRGDSEATTISDLAGLDYVIGASAQCPERPQCLIGFEDPAIYGIVFKKFVTLEFGPLLGEALSNKEVDVVMWNTTAPQITEEGFKVLDDDKGLFPAQNLVPIISTEVLDTYGDQLAAAINELSAAISTDDLLEWNTRTDIDKLESDAVATDWLTTKGLI